MKAIKGLNCPGKTHSNDICQHPCIPWHSVGMICVSRELQPCSQKLGGYLHVIEYYVVSCTYTFLTKGSQVNCVEKLSELCRHLQRIARKPFPVTHSKICIFYMEVFTASFHLYSCSSLSQFAELWKFGWENEKLWNTEFQKKALKAFLYIQIKLKFQDLDGLKVSLTMNVIFLPFLRGIRILFIAMNV